MILLDQLVYGKADYYFFVVSVGIIAAYLAISISFLFLKSVFRHSRLSWMTRGFGIAFFLTAAESRAELAWHALTQQPYLNLTNVQGVPVHVNIINTVLFISIWGFFLGLARDLSKIE